MAQHVPIADAVAGDFLGPHERRRQAALLGDAPDFGMVRGDHRAVDEGAFRDAGADAGNQGNPADAAQVLQGNALAAAARRNHGKNAFAFNHRRAAAARKSSTSVERRSVMQRSNSAWPSRAAAGA